MFFFLYCVVFLFGFGCFFIIVFLSERQIYAFMFAVFVSGSGLDGFYSILAGGGFYRFARVGAAFAFLLPCAGFGCAPAVLRRVR